MQNQKVTDSNKTLTPLKGVLKRVPASLTVYRC